MQDKYVGDVGDFGKFGLLRTLQPEFRLGIAWYMVADEHHNNDGKYTDYLMLPPGIQGQFRNCDPVLYDTLGQIVRTGNRRVGALESSGLLPENTQYARQYLTGNRQQWLDDVLCSTADADVVFCDPDNGITNTVKPASRLGSKYIFIDDIDRFYSRGQSLIVYHHFGRQGTALEAE